MEAGVASGARSATKALPLDFASLL